MLIRISLIVAILAGLGVAGIALFPLKQQVADTIKARDDFHTKLVAETKEKVTAQNLAKSTQAKLDTTTKELASTVQQRDAAKAAEDEATKKAADLQLNLTKTKSDLDATKDKLAAWENINIPIQQVKETIATVKQTIAEKEALEAEKAIIFAKANRLQDELDFIHGKNVDPELPSDLTGTVAAVDPRYDFVVLNVGEKQGVKQRGKLLVSRNAKLVAEVVVTGGIEANQCIANVMPGWKLSDVMEGDVVFPASVR